MRHCSTHSFVSFVHVFVTLFSVPAQTNDVESLKSPVESDLAAAHAHSSDISKRTKLTKELLDTEIKYCRDLTMCYRIFSQGLHAVINSNLADQLFLNCEQLIRTSQLIADSLAQDSPGDAFVKHAEVLRAYVEFCSKQQSALEKLNELEQTNAAFRQVHRSCCMQTNGLNLSYFLLLPMNRITRYPLIFEKLVKYTDAEDPKRESTEKAYMLLKSMCAEINSVISAMDNSNMLVWAQQHIHCESIQPPLVFPSSTRKVGPRSLLHSGALQKQRSGKTLVAFLFNDFFMLTTPAEPIEQLEEFRIQKTSEIHLNLYKTPLLLENIRAFQNKEMDSCSFEVRSGDVSVALRAPNRNARVFWMAQIEKAVNEYRGCCQTVKPPSLAASDTSGLGRLLVELICIRNMDSALRLMGTYSVSCKFQLGESSTYADVNLNKREHLCTTQLPILETSSNEHFEVAVLLNRFFSPDLCAGTGRIAMADLLTAAAAHRGPMSRQLHCEPADISNLRPAIILKFVVQLFY